MSNKTRVAIIGGGTFGQTLGDVLLEAGRSEVAYCARDKVTKQYSAEGVHAVQNADVVVIAVNSEGMHYALNRLNAFIPKKAPIISAVKGLQYDAVKKQLVTMTEILHSYLENSIITALSGPNLSKEIKLKVPTKTDIAVEKVMQRETGESLCELFYTPTFLPSVSYDPLGLQLAGALKNPLALAAGIAFAKYQGASGPGGSLLELGWDDIDQIYRRSLMDRNLLPEGLPSSGLGDLYATATSFTSRNFKFGFEFGTAAMKGKEEMQKVKQALEDKKGEENSTVEGLPTLDMVCAYAKAKGLRLQILPELKRSIDECRTPEESILNLARLHKRVAVHRCRQAYERERKNHDLQP